MSMNNTQYRLLAGIALILLSNIAALAGAWYNRQAEPESRLLLSERELRPDTNGPRQENTGLSLRLQWRRPSPDDAGNRYEHANLTQEQLLALGFAAPSQQEYRQRAETRQVLIVLELDGAAYRQQIHRAERRLQRARHALAAEPADSALLQEEKSAESELEDERLRQSRLFAIDVGLDATHLRQRYADRARYALLPGTLRVWCDCRGDTRQLIGQISRLNNDELNVPYAWRSRMAKQLANSYFAAQQPPMQVQVSFGQRLEPWISDIPSLSQ